MQQLHWSELPAKFCESMEAHAAENALVFEGIGFFDIVRWNWSHHPAIEVGVDSCWSSGGAGKRISLASVRRRWRIRHAQLPLKPSRAWLSSLEITKC